MPANDPKDLRPPIKYKPRHVAHELCKAEIKAAADRAEVRSRLATTRPPADQHNSSASALEELLRDGQRQRG